MAENDIPAEGIPARPPPAANPFTGLNRDELDRIVEQLEEDNQIGLFRDKARSYRRYVDLRTSPLSTRLINLYSNLFTTHWNVFKHTMSGEAPAGFASKAIYLATIYVSAWIWDLHVSIRESVRRISGTAFNQLFQQDAYHQADRYDPFLQHLNTIIRPTPIHQALEDTLYIPVVSRNIDWANANNNVFGLPSHAYDDNILNAILDVMDDRRNQWSTIPISTNVLGRPGWLLDYRLGQAYAWFPMEANYSQVDLIAPHILGTPCTPRLGPRDKDDWQVFRYNAAPPPGVRLNPHDFRRATERSFYGSAEYRTIEHAVHVFDWQATIPPPDAATSAASQPGKRKQGDSSTSAMALMETDKDPPQPFVPPPPVDLNRYRLIDWCYHARVIDGEDQQTRNRALRNFIFQAGHQPT
nr:putative coat protein [Carnation cryptic virus 3]